jgi:hypothetical protein
VLASTIFTYAQTDKGFGGHDKFLTRVSIHLSASFAPISNSLSFRPALQTSSVAGNLLAAGCAIFRDPRFEEISLEFLKDHGLL